MDTRDQYGNRVGQTDSYGNPIHQQQATDAYGNPIQQTRGQGTTNYGAHEGVGGHHGMTGGMGHGMTGGGYGGGQVQMMHPEDQHRGASTLRRSGSSSSSSSEDDGMGGRRKKGLKEKIKEKLPGGQTTDEYGQLMHGQSTTGYGGTTTAGAAGVYHEPEKKGMMEKIKEKLPGHH